MRDRLCEAEEHAARAEQRAKQLEVVLDAERQRADSAEQRASQLELVFARKVEGIEQVNSGTCDSKISSRGNDN